jgi:16S rRNA (cytidine1402-2'-O)-methyltransferase
MGTLYVVATPIGNLDDITARGVATLRAVALIAAEDTRQTARLLQRFDINTPTMSLHQHNERQRIGRLLDALDDGNVALVTDAGTPAVSDPGAVAVRAAREAGHRVVPIPGPSALVAAVSASGLVDGPFLFAGFLPRAGEERRAALGRAVGAGVPVVLFESANRLSETLHDLETWLGDVEAIVARELTKVHEEVRGGTLSALGAHYGAAEPRGEVVIVAAPAERPTSADAGDVSGLAGRLLADGMKPSRAARELAKIAGIPSEEAYEIVRSVRIADGPTTGELP